MGGFAPNLAAWHRLGLSGQGSLRCNPHPFLLAALRGLRLAVAPLTAPRLTPRFKAPQTLVP
jgi:hypothetical protein